MFGKFFTRSNCLAARLSSVGFVAAVLMTSSPVCADVYWSTSAGDWSNAANWGGAVPTGSDNAYIVNGGSATITQMGEVCNVLSLGNTGSGAINMTAGGLSAVECYVGGNGVGSFAQSGGTDNAGYLYLGGGSLVGSGTYNLNGSGLLSVNYAEAVGNSGTGSFTQSGGKNNLLPTGGVLYLGANPGSNGAYNLNGSGWLSAELEWVGFTGTGSFTQSAGTNVNEGLTLGYGTGSSGTYNLNGGVLQIISLSQGSGSAAFNFSGGTLQAENSIATSLPMTLGTGGGGATFASAGATITLSGSLSGPGSLRKVDSGTLILSANNSYTGDTLVNAGTLILDYPDLAATSNAWVDNLGSGGVLDLNYSGTDSISALNINGVAQAAGIWGGPGSGAPNTSSYLAGSGLLNVAVPEPSMLALLAAGAIGLAAYGWPRRRATRIAKPAAFDEQDAPATLPFHSHSSQANAARRAA